MFDCKFIQKTLEVLSLLRPIVHDTSKTAKITWFLLVLHWAHSKRSYSISNIGNMMGCDHQSCVPDGPFTGELWHFEYFPTITTVRQLLIFDHMTVIAVLTCCCIPNFIKIGSRVRPPDAHDCIMFNAPLLGNGAPLLGNGRLGNGRRHGNRIIADMSGT